MTVRAISDAGVVDEVGLNPNEIGEPGEDEGVQGDIGATVVWVGERVFLGQGLEEASKREDDEEERRPWW